MDLLTVAASNSTEIIGEGLLNALSELSKDKSIANLANSMENLATNTAAAVVQLSKVIGKITDLTSSPSFKAALIFFAVLSKKPAIVTGALGYVGGTGILELATKDYGLGNQGGTPFGQAGSADQLAKDKEKKIQADLLKLRAKENALIKEKNALEDLKKKYDTERIGLMLALNQATDEETRLRIAEKLAILDGNAAKAQQYLADLNVTVAANALATSATTAAGALNFLANGMPALFNSLGELTGRGRNQIAPDEFARLPQGVTNMGAQTAATAAANDQTTATLTLDPNASSDKLISAIGELVLVNLKYGNKLVPAGSIL